MINAGRNRRVNPFLNFTPKEKLFRGLKSVIFSKLEYKRNG